MFMLRLFSSLFFLADAHASEGPWAAPNVWNTALSGVAVVLLPVLFRVLWLRPRLFVSFDAKSDDLAKNISMQVGPNLFRIQDWFRLRVKNKGLASLTSPRAWCLGISVAEGSTFPFPVTPFELAWSETDKDFQIGAIVPGNFLYRLDLGYLDTALVRSSSLSQPINDRFVVSRRNQQETILLDNDLTYDLCLVISNENILVPAHFIHVQVLWKTANSATPLPLQPKCFVKIVNQGDYWWAKLLCRLRRFEN